MNNIDFKKEFILVNFDDMLLSCNNPLINSDDYYIKYKSEYFKQTQQNYLRFTQLQNNIQNDVSTSNNNKYTFIFRDESEENIKLEAQHEMKTIILQQRKALNNFMHYILQINADFERMKTISNQRKSKNIFTMFLDRNKH